MTSGGQLAERTAELEAIDAALASARDDVGRLLLIEGPAGVGKTALLGAALTAARAAGMRALDARAGEFERGLPFEIVRQLFARRLTREPELLARVSSGAAAPAASIISGLPPSSDAPSAPVEIYYALYWLVANLSEDTPTLLAIDDLQWADPSSREWLLYLARRLGDLALVVICTWRTGTHDGRGVFERLADEPVSALLRPAPLSEPGVAMLLSGMLGREAPSAACAAAHAITAGNPFLVTELGRALRGVEVAGADDVKRARPDSVTRAIVRRLGEASEHARRLADAIAILGDGTELRHAASLAGLDEREAAVAADELATASILQPGRPLRFEHPLVRAALHDARPIQERDRAHLEAARLLDAEGGLDRVVASHLLAAPAMGDEWAFERLFHAGSEALRSGAAPEALELLERALAEPPRAERRHELLVELALAEVSVRNPAAAAHAEEAIESSPDPEVRVRAALALALELWALGQFGQLELLLERAIEDAEHADPEHRLMLLAFLACGLPIGYTNSERAREALAEAAAEFPGTTTGECLLLAVASYERLCSTADASAALELARRATRTNQLLAGYPFNNPPANQAMLTLIACDELDAARAALEAAITSAAGEGALATVSICEGIRCSLHWQAGELLESEASGRIAQALLADTPGGARLGLSYLSRTLVDRGQLEEAGELITALEPPAGRVTPGRNVYWSARAHFEFALGDPAAAARSALTLANFSSAAVGVSCVIPWRLQAAIGLAASGEADRARELLAEQRPITERWSLPRARALLLRAEGLVEQDSALLEQAVTLLRGTPARLELARTLIDLGALLRRTNQRAAAREPLRTGLDLAHRCGAVPLEDRATEELAATGARPRRAMLSGVDSLTASERRIARLAAEGLSNPEIAQALYVSRKTVESHLGRIYQKLGVQRNGLRAVLDAKAA